MQRSLTDLEAWWKVQLPAVYGIDWEPLEAYVGYSSRPSARPPRCGEERRPRYEDEEGNAYYCPPDDFIAWDDEGLLPNLLRDYGPVAIGMVLAHEMGHAVQARAEVELAPVLYELQADCFAGAWLRRVTGPGAAALRHPVASIDDAVAAIVVFSDDPGDSPDDVNAHGSGFDRVSALQLGYEQGVRRCAAFVERPPTVTAAAFSSVEEERSGGDLPLPELLDAVPIELAGWWRRTDARVPAVVLRGSTLGGVERMVEACDGAYVFDGVAGACLPARAGGAATVAYDAAELRRLHREIGDFAVATVLGQAWSTLWQARTGRTTADRTAAAEREATCATGAWTRSLGPAGGAGRLSPGDLDEAILTILELPGPSTAFRAIAALRRGHGGGIRACR